MIFGESWRCQALPCKRDATGALFGCLPGSRPACGARRRGSPPAGKPSSGTIREADTYYKMWCFSPNYREGMRGALRTACLPE
jgi:hypothetical protein